MTQYLEGSTGRLPISDYTAKIVKQTIVHGPKSKNTPYTYEVLREVDLTKLTMAELEVIERNAWDIADKCIKEMDKRR